MTLIGGYLFYKILPKGVNCTFLRKPEYFDGCLEDGIDI
jgi:hypothetical protein